ncbi:hypothetical protein L211DRAFT_399495 [Terfezia boudieri ATCC MYA-4762]|uniref:HMA domain-containing protein n=1 Tax=Terfezia boudieri ATCC MYA-4762 TaxID=1051890 RepID=A0A3N4MJS3_9PEZI|nr:hypothetical protein L211DRAFT_399495 [Terfezia boudieri ATCC MYA-4762]
MSEHHYEFEVKMACGGCSGAVERVLKKTEGVKEVDIDLKAQTVKVTTSSEVSFDLVREKIGKTGKEILSSTQVD